MRFSLKVMSILLLVGLSGSLLQLWFQTYVVGKYYATAGFFFLVFGALWPIFVIGLTSWIVVKIKSQ